MVRKDLLKKALEVDEGYFEYKKLRLHNSLINKLRKHYKIYEAVKNFYDDEDIEDKEKKDGASYMARTYWPRNMVCDAKRSRRTGF